MRSAATAIVLLGALTSCAPTEASTVRQLVESGALTGQALTVSGVLKIDHGYYNLHSPDHARCVGLLLTNDQRARYGSLEGARVTVAGRFDAEGCGRNGLCVEDLCGPAVLTDISSLDERRR